MIDRDSAKREAWITGIGIVSSLGEGLETHWDALQNKTINVDTTTFAPYIVHPIARLNYDLQIPKKGDQRQMETWQRIGTYAAGLALDSAGLKGNQDILARMDMIVAASGGDRDLAVDSTIMNADARGNSPPGFFNERLMSDLRPTLFLAQLSNLLAGNVAIVHGVTGSSRTFMGGENAGADAIKIALARIEAGQSDIALIGSAHNSERKDLLMFFEFGDFNLKNEYSPVWARGERDGFAIGSAGVFLVVESKEHAQARGAKPYARLSKVVTDRARRDKGSIIPTLDALWTQIGASAGADTAILTGASGANRVTAEERAFLEKHRGIPVRATGTAFGHTVDAQFLLGTALAALSIWHRKLFPANDPTGFEAEATAAPNQIVVVSTGHWSGEGMALVEATD